MLKAERRTYTVISCHFGDPFWITELCGRILKWRSDMLASIVIVNQDRTPASRVMLESLSTSVVVREHPLNTDHIDVLGHDHPSSLNHEMRQRFFSSHVIIMDSDCLPVRGDWLNVVDEAMSTYDAIVARDAGKYGLSHPCFMVLPVQALAALNFAEGLLEVGIDTGRLVGLQLVKAGLPTRFESPSPAFQGRRGDFFLDSRLYHHGSASFISSDNVKLSSQVKPLIEDFWKKKVKADDWGFGVYDRLRLNIIRRRIRFGQRLR